MIITSKKKLAQVAASNTIAAQILVHELMLASFLGSSLASMTEQDAASVKRELGDRLDVAAEAIGDGSFRAAFKAAGAAFADLVNASEKDIRDRGPK